MSGPTVIGAAVADLLFDTDVFIDHLRGVRRMPGVRGSYSVMTRCELFAGNERKELVIDALLAQHSEVALTPTVAIRAGRLRKATSRLHTPDAIIAATALEHQMTLVTRNARDFGLIDELQVADPRSI